MEFVASDNRKLSIHWVIMQSFYLFQSFLSDMQLCLDVATDLKWFILLVLSVLSLLQTLSGSSASGGEREHLYKVLVIGELGCGKTSIVKRYVHQFFSEHYRATVSLLIFIFHSRFFWKLLTGEYQPMPF
jgi:hypothetical protein